jgi:hypothetical protein
MVDMDRVFLQAYPATYDACDSLLTLLKRFLMFPCIPLLAFEENGVRAYYSPELLIFRMSACHIICAGQQQGYQAGMDTPL